MSSLRLLMKDSNRKISVITGKWHTIVTGPNNMAVAYELLHDKTYIII